MNAIKGENKSSKKLLTQKWYQLINDQYKAFPIVYKYIHWIDIKNIWDINIEKSIYFVYWLLYGFDNANNSTLDEKIAQLKAISNKEYQKLAHDNFIIFLWEREIDVEDYFQIKDLIGQIASVRRKFNTIFNLDDIQKEAYKHYLDSNGNLDENVIDSVKNNVQNTLATEKRKERTLKAKKVQDLQNYKEQRKESAPQRLEEKKKEVILSRSDKLKEKQEELKLLIREELQWIGKNFLYQLDALIQISIKWWENDDPRYKNFWIASINIPSAIEYIKAFIHDNKWDLKGENLRFFTFNSSNENQKVISNDDISSNVAEYFITRVKYLKLINE